MSQLLTYAPQVLAVLTAALSVYAAISRANTALIRHLKDVFVTKADLARVDEKLDTVLLAMGVAPVTAKRRARKSIKVAKEAPKQ